MGVLQNWYFCSRCALQAAARRRGAAVQAFIHHHVTHPSLFCFCFFQTSFWTMCTKQVFSLKKTRRHFKAHIDAFFAWVKILGRLKGCRKRRRGALEASHILLCCPVLFCVSQIFVGKSNIWMIYKKVKFKRITLYVYLLGNGIGQQKIICNLFDLFYGYKKTPLFHGTCISSWGAPIRKIPKASRLFFYNGYSDGNELKTIYFTIGLKIFLVVTEFGK